MINAMLRQRTPKSTIARKLKVSPPTLYKCIYDYNRKNNQTLNFSDYTLDFAVGLCNDMSINQYKNQWFLKLLCFLVFYQGLQIFRKAQKTNGFINFHV